MVWTYELLKSMVSEHFNIDENDIGLNSYLSDLGIATCDFIDFLVDNKGKIEECGYMLKNESTLYFEVRSNRTIYELFSIIVMF